LTGVRANLFLVALGLSLLGLVMVYSATWRDYGTHYLLLRAGHVAVGVGVFFLASRVRYTAWRRYVPGLYLAVLAGLVLVLIPGIGTEAGGARRWLDLGPLSVQPGEFAKLAVVLGLSCAVARVPPGSRLPLRPLAAVVLLFGLVVVEPDFGTSVVLIAGAAGVLWASELRTRDLVLSALAAFVVLVGVMLTAPYRRERFMTFLDPWTVADSSGYQVVQSLVAIKAGGFFGSGAGAGSQGVAVPELGTDMIFALIGEELGLFGMVGVILAFGFIAFAGFRISLQAPTVLGRCIAAGLTTILAVQAIFNMGAAMVVLPLAGMTLPFISYGGSSLVVCFAAVGILYRISEDSERAREARPRRRKAANSDSGRRYRGARDPRAVRGG
jgi:cell division protein FtsW